MVDGYLKRCDRCGHTRTEHQTLRVEERYVNSPCMMDECPCADWEYNIMKNVESTLFKEEGKLTGVSYDAKEMNRTRDFFESFGVDPYATLEERRQTQLFKKADELVNGSREEIYGPPEINFQTIADLWTAMGFRVQAWNGDIRNITATDVALGMTQVKMGRLRTSPDHVDTWVDGIGYLGLGGEVATIGQDLPWMDKDGTTEESPDGVIYEYVALPSNTYPDAVNYFHRCQECYIYIDEKDFASHAWMVHHTRSWVISDSLLNEEEKRNDPKKRSHPLRINFTLLPKKRFSRKPPRVQCDECKATMNYGFIQTHMDVVHQLTMNYTAPSLKSS